jgi:hypothetical protein
MITIGVWQGKKGLLTQSLLRFFPDGNYVLRPPECDICVSDGPLPDVFSPCRCRIAILPGDKTLDCRYLQAGRVVTYGISGKNTVALSSVDEDRLFIALQREIISLDGRRIEQQEMLIHNAPLTNSTLAGATAMLIAGGGERNYF